MQTLRGEKVVLRPPQDGDAAALRAIHATPQVAAWWGLPSAAFPADADAGTVRWVITVDGAVAGLIDVTEEDDPHFRKAALDLFVDPARHRRGIATDAIRAVLRDLEARGHHHVTIDPAVDNAPAIGCYESVGFRRVGVLRRDWRDFHTGEWRDTLLLDLLIGAEADRVRNVE